MYNVDILICWLLDMLSVRLVVKKSASHRLFQAFKIGFSPVLSLFATRSPHADVKPECRGKQAVSQPYLIHTRVPHEWTRRHDPQCCNEYPKAVYMAIARLLANRMKQV
jgi:hypothetical protein